MVAHGSMYRYCTQQTIYFPYPRLAHIFNQPWENIHLLHSITKYTIVQGMYYKMELANAFDTTSAPMSKMNSRLFLNPIFKEKLPKSKRLHFQTGCAHNIVKKFRQLG